MKVKVVKLLGWLAVTTNRTQLPVQTEWFTD